MTYHDLTSKYNTITNNTRKRAVSWSNETGIIKKFLSDVSPIISEFIKVVNDQLPREDAFKLINKFKLTRTYYTRYFRSSSKRLLLAKEIVKYISGYTKLPELDERFGDTTTPIYKALIKLLINLTKKVEQNKYYHIVYLNLIPKGHPKTIINLKHHYYR